MSEVRQPPSRPTSGAGAAAQVARQARRLGFTAFGGGVLVLLAFLRSDFVVRLGWLTTSSCSTVSMGRPRPDGRRCVGAGPRRHRGLG